MSIETPARRGSERRRHPRGDTISSLNQILEAARLRHGLSTLVLADDCGLLIAGSGHFGRCEELAAGAPVAHEAQRSTVRVDGVDLLLACEGAKLAGIEFVRSACQRVLGRRAAPVAI